MARFLPYDSTGFARFDPKTFREPFGARAKWLTPQQLAKPKDWDTPQGLANALKLTQAAIQHPAVDLAVKGIGDAVRGTKPTPGTKYEELLGRAAKARASAKKAGGVYAATDEEIRRSLGGMTVPSDEDIRLFREAGGVEVRKLVERAKKLEDEAKGLELVKGVKSLDDLMSLVTQPGATQAHLSAALRHVARFTPARGLAEIQAGKDPAAAMRKQLIGAFISAQGKPITQKDLLRHQIRTADLHRKQAADLARKKMYEAKTDLGKQNLQRLMKKSSAEVDRMYARMNRMSAQTLAEVLRVISRTGKEGKRIVRAVFVAFPDIMKKAAEGSLHEVRIPEVTPGARRKGSRKRKTSSVTIGDLTREVDDIKNPRDAKNAYDLAIIMGGVKNVYKRIRQLHTVWAHARKGKGKIRVSPEAWAALRALQKKILTYKNFEKVKRREFTKADLAAARKKIAADKAAREEREREEEAAKKRDSRKKRYERIIRLWKKGGRLELAIKAHAKIMEQRRKAAGPGEKDENLKWPTFKRSSIGSDYKIPSRAYNWLARMAAYKYDPAIKKAAKAILELYKKIHKIK